MLGKCILLQKSKNRYFKSYLALWIYVGSMEGFASFISRSNQLQYPDHRRSFEKSPYKLFFCRLKTRASTKYVTPQQITINFESQECGAADRKGLLV